MPNIYKIVIFIIMSFITIYAIGISFSLALTDVEEKFSTINGIISIFFVWPLLAIGNLIAGLSLNIIYIYILSCIIYFSLFWLKNKLKQEKEN